MIRLTFLALISSLFLCQAEAWEAVSQEAIGTVTVDAVIIGPGDEIVEGIDPGDLMVFENGARQEIERAAFRDGSDTPSEDPEKSPVWIVIVLDHASLEAGEVAAAEKAAIQYVEGIRRPADYVAVFSLGDEFRLLEPFTNDSQGLIEAIEEKRPSDISIAAGKLSAEGSSSQDERLRLARRIGQLQYNMGAAALEHHAQALLSAVQAASLALAPVEGRKALVLFSQGFEAGSDEPALRRAIEAANRARLTVYGFDPKGPADPQAEDLGGDSDSNRGGASGRDREVGSSEESLLERTGRTGRKARHRNLRYLAGATGGYAVAGDGLLDGLQRVDEEIHSHYVIRYRPSNQQLDGRYREIRVLIRGRNDLEARHRSGYRAVPAGLEILEPDDVSLLRAKREGAMMTELPVQGRTAVFHRSGPRQEVMLALEVPGNQIRFQRRQNQGRSPEGPGRDARLQIVGLVRDASGTPVRRVNVPVSIHVGQQRYRAIRRGKLSLSHRVDLIPGEYSFRIVLEDRFSKRIGFFENTLEIPPRSAEPTLSGIALGRRVEGSSSGREPLSGDGLLLLPSASHVFAAGEEIACYLELYNVPTGESGGEQAQVEITLRRPGGQPLLSRRQTLGGSDTQGFLPMAHSFQSTDLQPGAYELVAQASAPSGNQTAESRTEFEIVEK